MDKLLTVKEVAEKLNVGVWRVRELLNNAELKGAKIGNWRIRKEDLEEYIESRMQ